MKKKNEEFDFGENLESLVLKKFKSISAFAREAGINKKTLEGWIGRGARFPSKPEYIKQMADTLGISVHELMFGRKDEHESLASVFDKTEIHTALYEISIRKVSRKE